MTDHAVDSPLLEEVGRGPSNGRSPTPSDPWSSEWTPPAHDEVGSRHERARRAQQAGRLPSQGIPAPGDEPLEPEPAQDRDPADIAGAGSDLDAPRDVDDSIEHEPTPPIPLERERRDPGPFDDDGPRADDHALAHTEHTSDDGVEDELATMAVPGVGDDATSSEADDLVDDLLEEFHRLTAASGAPIVTEPPPPPSPPPPRVGRPTVLEVVEGALALDPAIDDEPPPPPPPPTATEAEIVELAGAADTIAAEERAEQTSERRLGVMLSGLVITATAYWYYAIATLALAVAVPLVAGWHSTTVMSGSMEPVLQPGDVVAFDEWDREPLGVGTIIQFEDPARPGQTTTHRIVGVNNDGTYVTKGDANQTADSTPVAPEAIVGVATLVSPYAGLPRYWFGTRQFGWLGLWALGTAVAFVVISVHKRIEGPARRRPWVRAAVALGIVAAIAGVGTAAWSAASFVASTSNADNRFGAESSFTDVTHHGSLGVGACSTNRTTALNLTRDVPAGRTIIVRVSLRNQVGNGSFGATDSAGNTYSVDADAANNKRARTAILRAHVTTGLAAGDTITVDHPRGRAVVVSVDEFSGITPGAPVAAGTATGNSATPSVSVAVPTNNTLTVASLALRGTAGLTPPTSSWSYLDYGDIACQRRMTYGGAYVEENLATTVVFDPGLTTSRHWAVAAASYPAG